MCQIKFVRRKAVGKCLSRDEKRFHCVVISIKCFICFCINSSNFSIFQGVENFQIIYLNEEREEKHFRVLFEDNFVLFFCGASEKVGAK